MPRTARSDLGGICYHVLNRGNGRATVFHKPEDYEAFLRLIPLANERLPMRVLAYCLMPNHFHLVLRPREDGDLGRWMQWLMTSHVRRHHRHFGTSGHLWQGRFKAFPIQRDEHLLAVIRYSERNPLRAKLVDAAEDWRWSSLRERLSKETSEILYRLPMDLPRDWRARVNRPQTVAEEAALRKSLERGSPFGSERWTKLTATRLNLQHSLNPRGRPRKDQEK
jgi:putative transposase